MARTPRKQAPGKTITVNAEQYRSLILAKLRAEISAKRAALDAVSNIDPSQINEMSYYKMAYYKMKYWKMGHIMLESAEDTNNPETEKTKGLES